MVVSDIDDLRIQTLEHLLLIGILLNFTIGISVITRIWQVRHNNSDLVITPVFYYVVLTNAMILMALIFTYIYTNFSAETLSSLIHGQKNFYHLIFTLVELGMLYAMTTLVFRFTHRKRLKLVHIIFSVLMFITTLIYILPIGMETGFGTTLSVIQTVLFENVLMLEIPMLLFIWWKSRGRSEGSLQAQTFAAIFLARYIIIIAFLPTLFLPDDMRRLIIIIPFCLINLAPYYWLKKYYIPSSLTKRQAGMDARSIEMFFKEKGLSSREIEIALLATEGKSNKQIAEELFISPVTVRNHLSSIFNKLDVKNRTQLSNLAHTSRST